MTYIPRLSHAIFTAVLSVLCAFAWADNGNKGLIFGAIVFICMTGSIMLSLIESAHYFSVIGYIEALVKMDTDLRNALAFNVPALRLIAKRGTVLILFADTRATKKHIQLFLSDSTREYTASRRNWTTAERPRWAWDEIYDYLLRRKMVGAFSVGPDSYPWIGSAYQNLCIYFLTESIQDLNAETREYAEDTNSPTM
jgi:hypothetical protein